MEFPPLFLADFETFWSYDPCGMRCATMSGGVKIMNKSFWRFCLLLILNIVPFFIACVLYKFGAWIQLMFPILQIIINSINYRLTTKVISFVFLNMAMLISSIANTLISTKLYYANVSSDSETLLVGYSFAQIAFVFITLMTLISIVCRIVSNKRSK